MVVLKTNGNQIIITGNSVDLNELAKHIKYVSDSNIKGKHIHLDQSNFFDESSRELIIEKTDEN